MEEVCTITSKGQTTVPRAIRKVLGVGYGDRIVFRVQDGAVSVHAVSGTGSDPALAPFLTLLERDIAARPAQLTPVSPDLVARVIAATQGIEADIDAPIEGEVAL